MKKFLFIIFIFALGHQNIFAACTSNVNLNNQEITNAKIISTSGENLGCVGIDAETYVSSSFHIHSSDTDSCLKLGNYYICTGQHSDSSKNLLYVMHTSWDTNNTIFTAGSMDMTSDLMNKPYVLTSPANHTSSPPTALPNGSFYVNGNLYLSKGLKIYNDEADGNRPDTSEFKGVYFHSKYNVSDTNHVPASVYVEGGNTEFIVSDKFLFSGVGYGDHCQSGTTQRIHSYFAYNSGGITGQNAKWRGYLKIRAGETLLSTIMRVRGQATTADLAELFPISDLTIESGDIVAVDPGNKITLKKGEKTKKSHIVGVVSTNPALIFEGNQIIMNKDIYELKQESKTPLALAGRVPVKISLEGGPIKIGDPITISSQAGVGMKANESGMIVGIALDDYEKVESNNDKIYIFVNTKWYTNPQDAKDIAQIDQEIQDLEEESVALEAEISAMYNTILNLKKQGKL